MLKVFAKFGWLADRGELPEALISKGNYLKPTYPSLHIRQWVTRWFVNALALFCLSSPAAAFDLIPDAGDVYLRSYHVDAKRDFEEFNIGGGLVWDLAPKTRGSIGRFRNSYGDWSWQGSVEREIAQGEFLGIPVAADLFLGAAHYPDAGNKGLPHWNDIIAFGGVQGRARVASRTEVIIGAIPSRGDASAVFTARLRFDFGGGR